MEEDLVTDTKHLKDTFVADMKAEGAHIADPEQCGVIVRKHFSGLLFTLLAFTAFVLAAAVIGVYFYMHH